MASTRILQHSKSNSTANNSAEARGSVRWTRVGVHVPPRFVSRSRKLLAPASSLTVSVYTEAGGQKGVRPPPASVPICHLPPGPRWHCILVTHPPTPRGKRRGGGKRARESEGERGEEMIVLFILLYLELEGAVHGLRPAQSARFRRAGATT